MIIKNSSKNKNGYTVKMSRKEWLSIGKKAGWVKTSQLTKQAWYYVPQDIKWDENSLYNIEMWTLDSYQGGYDEGRDLSQEDTMFINKFIETIKQKNLPFTEKEENKIGQQFQIEFDRTPPQQIAQIPRTKKMMMDFLNNFPDNQY